MRRSTFKFPSFGLDRLGLFSRNRPTPLRFALHLTERSGEVSALVTALGGTVVNPNQNPDVVIVEDYATGCKPNESYPEDIIVTQQFIGNCIVKNRIVDREAFRVFRSSSTFSKPASPDADFSFDDSDNSMDNAPLRSEESAVTARAETLLQSENSAVIADAEALLLPVEAGVHVEARSSSIQEPQHVPPAVHLKVPDRTNRSGSEEQRYAIEHAEVIAGVNLPLEPTTFSATTTLSTNAPVVTAIAVAAATISAPLATPKTSDQQLGLMMCAQSSSAKPTRREFSRRENVQMYQIIRKAGAMKYSGGKAIYKALRTRQEFKTRTALSLETHFKKSILPNLEKYESDIEILQDVRKTLAEAKLKRYANVCPKHIIQLVETIEAKKGTLLTEEDCVRILRILQDTNTLKYAKYKQVYMALSARNDFPKNYEAMKADFEKIVLENLEQFVDDERERNTILQEIGDLQKRGLTSTQFMAIKNAKLSDK